jgi:AcrR family transcriptional regulator
MSRTAGSRNADFEETRTTILDRVVHAAALHPERTSFAELADASGVSRTTLRHYFRSRDDLLRAMLEHMRVLSDRAGAAFPISSALSLEDALRKAVHQFVFSWRVGVGAMFTAGLLWGLGSEELGPACVANLLEPVLRSFEGLIAARLKGEGLADAEARHAALALVSPVLFALMHQESLHGKASRPLDLDVFVEAHLDRFFAGWFRRAPSR